MKKKLKNMLRFLPLVTITIQLSLLSSCEKKSEENTLALLSYSDFDCKNGHYGFIKISNKENSAYRIYVDGEYIDEIPAKTNMKLILGSGKHVLLADQKEGYGLFATSSLKLEGEMHDCLELSWDLYKED